MRRLAILVTFLLAFAITAKAQTNLVALPSPTAHQVNLNWTNACASSITCTFDVYRCAGTSATCTATSINWQLVNASPLAGVSYVDTAVTTNTTYSYEVYAVATVNGVLETSPPSNEATATVPLGPVAPASANATAQ